MNAARGRGPEAEGLFQIGISFVDLSWFHTTTFRFLAADFTVSFARTGDDARLIFRARHDDDLRACHVVRYDLQRTAKRMGRHP